MICAGARPAGGPGVGGGVPGVFLHPAGAPHPLLPRRPHPVPRLPGPGAALPHLQVGLAGDAVYVVHWAEQAAAGGQHQQSGRRPDRAGGAPLHLLGPGEASCVHPADGCGQGCRERGLLPGLTRHEQRCPARTLTCPEPNGCGQQVKLAEFHQHAVANSCSVEMRRRSKFNLSKVRRCTVKKASSLHLTEPTA